MTRLLQEPVEVRQALARSAVKPAVRAESDWLFVALTILALLVATGLPYAYAYLSTPADKQFMGIMLDVPDHVQYFSWMRELATAPLASNKLTPEANPPLFFNLLWWGLGRLGRVLQLGYAEMYQLFRVAVTVLFPLAVYRLCTWFLDDRLMRRTALLVILFGSGFGWVLVLLKYTLARGQLWFPLDVYIAEGNTFLGLLGYPHFIGAALYILVFDLVLRGEAQGKLRYAVAAGFWALFLAWQHAYDLLSIYAVLLAYAGLQLLRDRAWPAYMIKAGLIVGIISWWPALYSVILTSVDPLWREVLSQFVNAGVFTPGLLHLPILLGPAFLLALATVAKLNPLRLRQLDNRLLFLVGWFLVTFVLIYLPVEYQVHLLNGWQVPTGLLATIGVFRFVAPLIERLARRTKAFVSSGFIARRSLWAAAVVTLVLPTNVYLFAWRFFELRRQDYPYYLYRDELAAIGWLEDNAGPDDVILASLTVGQYLPMLTGSHAFLAHWAQTVGFFEKTKMVNEFYAGATSDRRRADILTEQGVDFVFWGPAERALGGFDPSRALYLAPVYRNSLATIFAVHMTDLSTMAVAWEQD